MAITALTGLPGHGKSYSAVALFLIQAATQGRAIVTNIPLTEQFGLRFPGVQVLPFDLSAASVNDALWDMIPPSAMIVLDELWRIWPSGKKADEIPKRQMSFIKEHRHYLDASGREPDIVLVTQDLSDIASSIRNMVEMTLICSKLVDLGLNKRFRRDVYRGAVKGFKGPQNALVKSDQLKYEPDIFELYRSHTLATAEVGEVDQRRAVDATIFKSFGFKAGVVVLVGVLFLAVWAFTRTRRGVEEMREKAKPVSKEIVAPGPVVKAVLIEEKPKESPKESEKWRLTGTYTIEGSEPVAVIFDGIKSRRLPLRRFCKSDLGEWSCEVRGEIVSRYTGRETMTVAQMASGFGRGLFGMGAK